MTESIITMCIVGLVVGFIFSMPIAGPISILVTSNALKGRLKYCNLVTLGASFADFVYVFAAVFGLTNYYSIYKPVIPYFLLAGTLLLVYLGIKIAKTKVDIEHIEDKKHIREKAQQSHHGAFWTGFMLNSLNPTLFLGWLTSSFIVISLVASLGFNTGGLDVSVENSYHSLNKKSTGEELKNKTFSYLHIDSSKLDKREEAEENMVAKHKHFPLFLSLAYAFFVSAGSIVWFFCLAMILTNNRHKININVINGIIRSLGVVLCILGLALAYKGITILIS